jgi:hypothetical protein
VGAAQEAAAGAALGALIAANAPVLTELDVGWSDLGDAALRPLFEALPANTHLRALIVTYNAMSEAFARHMLLPAVRANTSLLQLDADAEDAAAAAAVHEATALVAARARSRAHAAAALS